MDFDDYQEKARTTAIYGGMGTYAGLSYVTHGLAGEAGEVSGKVSKVWRDAQGVVSPEMRENLIEEAGDTLWFLSLTSDELGITLKEIAERNIQKLFSRKDRGVLGGSGDNR